MSSSNAVDINRFRFNRRALKIIAAISMLIDHLTCVLFANGLLLSRANFILRSVGRIAFPLYAFMMVEGVLHTRNKKKYLLTLLILSIMSEPFFDRALSGQWVYNGHQNVIWLFLFASLGITLIESLNVNKNIAAVVLLLPLGYITTLLKIDYGIFGMLPIMIFYIFRNDRVISALSILGTFFFEASMLFLVYVPVPILLLYNGKEPKLGKIEKLFYQYFYPLHLAILSVVAVVMGWH